MSISAWIFADSNSGNREAVVIRNNSGAADGSRAVQISLRSTALSITQWGGGTIVNSGVTIETGRWYHIIFTNDGTNKRVYIDGVMRSSSTTSMQAGTLDNLFIGTFSTALTQMWDGKIDEVKIYNYALTDEQVKIDYNNGAVKFE